MQIRPQTALMTHRIPLWTSNAASRVQPFQAASPAPVKCGKDAWTDALLRGLLYMASSMADLCWWSPEFQHFCQLSKELSCVRQMKRAGHTRSPFLIGYSHEQVNSKASESWDFLYIRISQRSSGRVIQFWSRGGCVRHSLWLSLFKHT